MSSTNGLLVIMGQSDKGESVTWYYRFRQIRWAQLVTNKDTHECSLAINGERAYCVSVLPGQTETDMWDKVNDFLVGKSSRLVLYARSWTDLRQQQQQQISNPYGSNAGRFF